MVLPEKFCVVTLVILIVIFLDASGFFTFNSNVIAPPHADQVVGGGTSKMGTTIKTSTLVIRQRPETPDFAKTDTTNANDWYYSLVSCK